ncbi:MAG: GntR family transcriptional regulator [bacterium]|jgi:DNA-binding GntR family transcriptional regulator|nr:GntR family transcriptional regulator [bacterium]
MNHTTLQAKAYQYIQSKILSGELAPGSHVSELSLAHEIGISRAPVRDAITQLQTEGYVSRVPRSGTIVRSLERHEIVELYELREALESYAAALAAQRATTAQIRKLEKYCDEFRLITKELYHSGHDELEGEILRRYLAVEMAFHMQVIHAAANTQIVKLVANTHIMSRLLSKLHHKHSFRILLQAYQYHKRILRAVKRSNPETAQRIMAQHIQVSKKHRLEAWDWNQAHKRLTPTTMSALPHDIALELNRIEQEYAIQEK